MTDIGNVNGLMEQIENCRTEETIMPMSYLSHNLCSFLFCHCTLEYHSVKDAFICVLAAFAAGVLLERNRNE